MRSITSEAQEILDSGRFGVRCLLYVELDDDTFAIWDDVGQIEVEGVTYSGAAGRFSVDGTVSRKDTAVSNVTVSLSGLDAEVIALIDGVNWHQRPILIQRALIATDAPAVLHIVPEFAGFLDQMVWRDRDRSVVEFRCESASREFSRTSPRIRSDADQRERDPDDGSLKFAASAANTPIQWGPMTTNPSSKAKPKGLLGKLLGMF